MINTSYLVFGYVRDIEKSNKLIIPSLVTHLCLLFYVLSEYFERARSDQFEISEDKLSITRKEEGSKG